MATRQSPEIELLLEGEGLSRALSDPEDVLRFGAAFFRLLKKEAARNGHEDLRFEGIAIRDGSVIFASRPTKPRLAKHDLNQMLDYLSGEARAPHGLTAEVDDLQTARIPFGTASIHVRLGEWRRPLPKPAETPPIETMTTLTSMRVVVDTIHVRTNRARLRQLDSVRAFTAEATPAVVDVFGSNPRGSFDITLRCEFLEDGSVSGAEVLKASPVSDAVDALEAWSQWRVATGASYTEEPNA